MKKANDSSSPSFSYLERKPRAVIALFIVVFLVIFAITIGGIVLSVYISESSLI